MWLFSRLFWPIHLRMPIDKDSVHDDASGEPGTLLAERERMHGMLQRQSGTFLEMAGRSAMVGSWVVDLPTRRFLWSDEVAAIYGMPASPMHEFDDAVGLFRSRWRDIFINRFEACARDGTPFDEEMEIVSAQGRNRWVRVMGQAVRDGQGAIVGLRRNESGGDPQASQSGGSLDCGFGGASRRSALRRRGPAGAPGHCGRFRGLRTGALGDGDM